MLASLASSRPPFTDDQVKLAMVLAGCEASKKGTSATTTGGGAGFDSQMTAISAVVPRRSGASLAMEWAIKALSAPEDRGGHATDPRCWQVLVSAAEVAGTPSELSKRGGELLMSAALAFDRAVHDDTVDGDSGSGGFDGIALLEVADEVLHRLLGPQVRSFTLDAVGRFIARMAALCARMFDAGGEERMGELNRILVATRLGCESYVELQRLASNPKKTYAALLDTHLAPLFKLRFGPLKKRGAELGMVPGAPFQSSMALLAKAIDTIWAEGLLHSDHVLGFPGAVDIDACLVAADDATTSAIRVPAAATAAAGSGKRRRRSRNSGDKGGSGGGAFNAALASYHRKLFSWTQAKSLPSTPTDKDFQHDGAARAILPGDVAVRRPLSRRPSRARREDGR